MEAASKTEENYSVEPERHLKAGRKPLRMRPAIRTGLDHLRDTGNRLTSEAAPQTIEIYGWLGRIGSSISRVKAASLLRDRKFVKVKGSNLR